MVKLAVTEDESSQLKRTLSQAERVFSSEISEIEVRRAVRRNVGAAGDSLAALAMSKVTIVELDRQARLTAVEVLPPTLRSLDAIHIATALGLNLPEVVFVGYDRRCQEAAAGVGLQTESPGA